ncbi:HAD family hydrolase [Ferviditalea candida]|uniref:HAD family hydrolase n=1 Tax=Ferviditalea candida TaxID=3108399 RepID=A0ABU5ZKK2_9BACL|nr:HAD family hydrolase [Paenibacillaceae bacterium T2]
MIGLPDVKGIIFDMDNTLLQSRIDYAAMKRDVFRFFVEHEVVSADLPVHAHTTSTIIELAKNSGVSEQLMTAAWEIVTRHEISGMQCAGIEPGTFHMLETLIGRFKLAVLTNNSMRSAHPALQSAGILSCFDRVVCREQMTALKPSASGIYAIFDHFPDVPRESWILIGDSWIDGRAAETAGIPFISYKADLKKLSEKSVEPVFSVSSMKALIHIL